MPGDLSIDLGSAVPYAVESVLALFGRDALSTSAKERLQKRIRISIEQASQVQCVGMDRPIPLAKIYQPARLRTHMHSNYGGDVNLTSLIEQGTDAIIQAGPGAGKSTLLHSALLSLLKQKDKVPVLFTLRSLDVAGDLRAFIDDLSKDRVVKDRRRQIVLLVDGYDEIPLKIRKEVSSLLQEFSSLKRGNFYLTCRLYYTIIDLHVPIYYLEPFGEREALSFVNAFLREYGAEYDASQLVAELHERGFADFLSSPLMLALVCILKTGPLPRLPQNSIGLIRRALDTLTFRWDEQKGIARAGEMPLDGEERIRCLMRIAFRFERPYGPESVAFAAAQEHLRFIQRPEVSTSRLLTEIAQWYGILVPASEGQWSFTHRSLHDFLAARFWVESGTFSAEAITLTKWNTRSAYAACLIPDATTCLVKSLQTEWELNVFVECLANNAPFDAREVAKAVVKRFTIDRLANDVQYRRTEQSVQVSIESDFFHLVNTELLDALVVAGAASRTRANDIVYVLSLSELRRRGRPLKEPARKDLEGLELVVVRAGEQIGPFRVHDL